jgi:hypothetical protein
LPYNSLSTSATLKNSGYKFRLLVGISTLHDWLLLHYKIPREPTAARVYVWRKLKRLGAVLLHDAVWVLPATPRTLEQFQWLAAEIVELEGESMLWESRLALTNQREEALVRQFLAQVDGEYAGVLAELEQIQGGKADSGPDLAALSRRYQQVKRLDYFHSELGRQVQKALVAFKGEGEEPEEKEVEKGGETES